MHQHKENQVHVCVFGPTMTTPMAGGGETPVSGMSRGRLVWKIKVRFVTVCARNGPCVGKGRGLNGGVVQSGASGRPPSDPHPRSEPLLVASHSERTPPLAVPTTSASTSYLLHPCCHLFAQPTIAQTLPASLAPSASLARVAHLHLPLLRQAYSTHPHLL